MIKIATFNVNSIRARIDNFKNWLNKSNPDIVLIQELKCTDEQFPFGEFSSFPYNIETNGQKSHNGVAIFSKYPLYDVVKELPLYDIVESDNEARYIEARIDCGEKTLKIASVYVPNGAPKVNEVDIKDITETGSFYNKMKFCRRLQKYLKEQLDNDENYILCGDFNVCPILEKDIYSVTKDGDITCTEKERVEFKKFLDVGYRDIFRDFYKDKQEYTYWGYRPYTSLEKNLGYRLDAILMNNNIAKFVKDCRVEKEPRHAEKPSDHTPLMALLDI